MAVATQVNHPWQATVRTVLSAIVGLAASYAVIVAALGLNTTWHWVAIGAGVAAAITRVLAVPAVDNFLNAWFPWLSANGVTSGKFPEPAPKPPTPIAPVK